MESSFQGNAKPRMAVLIIGGAGEESIDPAIKSQVAKRV
jgi:hypothetical protein